MSQIEFSPRAAAGQLLFAASILSGMSAAAQVDYELTYTEIRQPGILVLPLASGDTLSDLERTLALEPAADSLGITTGFRRGEGLYDEVVVLNPHRREREHWQSPLPAYHRMDAEGSTLRDGEGRLVLHQPPSERDRAERHELEALAASGRLTPFVRAIIPGAEEIEALRAQGYRVELNESSLAARLAGDGGDELDPGPVRTLLGGERGADSRILTAERPGERVVADAANGSLTTYTFADDTNAEPVAVRVRFLVPAEPIGGEGYLEALSVEVRADTLATGRPVHRTLTSRRSHYRYTGPGVEAASGRPSGREAFGSLVNPLSPGEILVAVPEAFRHAGATLTLIDAQGRLRARQVLTAGDEPVVTLALPRDTPAGAYVLAVDDGVESRRQLVVIH